VRSAANSDHPTLHHGFSAEFVAGASGMPPLHPAVTDAEMMRMVILSPRIVDVDQDDRTNNCLTISNSEIGAWPTR